LTSRLSAYSILIAPIGVIDTGLCGSVAREIERVFGCRSEIKPLLADVDFALDPVRRQYYSTVILQKLAAMAPDGALKIIAITQVDLFIPILTHVYGEAQLGGKTAIISTYRLHEASMPQLPIRRCTAVSAKKPFTNWAIPSRCATARNGPASCITAAAYRMLTASRIIFADTAGSCCRMNSASSDSLLSKTNDQSAERSPESSIDGVSGDLECRNDGSVESRRMGSKNLHCTPYAIFTADNQDDPHRFAP
jgi:hypothetical protein